MSCNSPASDFGEDERVFSRHMKLDTTANNFEGEKKNQCEPKSSNSILFFKTKAKANKQIKA